MSGRPASVLFDPRPLTEPADRHAVREYARRLRESGAVRSGFGSPAVVIAIVIGGVFFFMFGSVFVSIIGSVVSSLSAASTGDLVTPFVFGALGTVLPMVVMFAAIGAVAIVLVRGHLGRYDRWYRLQRFAAANGMSFVPTFASPGLPGMIFGIGSSRASSDLVRGDQPRFVEFANYQYTTGSGKNRTTHRWGYVAIKLDVPLPHIVLDAAGNNGLFRSNLPATFDKDQKLSLEGDFDRFFSLYCPKGYERDALYLFTPDIMARFIDNAAALDVEIVDDWLFLYGKREFSSLDPATWAWLFSVVAALLDKFAQWARWRDEQLTRDAALGATALPAGPGAETDARVAGEAGSAAVAGPVGAAGPAAGTAGAASALPFAAPAGALRPPPGVALGGRRLKRGVSWVSVALFILIGLFWLFGQFGGWGLLFR